VQEMEVLGDVILARSGDMIFIYDTAGETYGSDYACEVVLPMLDAKQPSAAKNLQGVDIVCYGTWAMEIGTDPARPDVRELVATISQPSYGMERLACTGYGTHFGVRLKHQADGPALLASVLLHFERGEND
jgi:hypothetical protein